MFEGNWMETGHRGRSPVYFPLFPASSAQFVGDLRLGNGWPGLFEPGVSILFPYRAMGHVLLYIYSDIAMRHAALRLGQFLNSNESWLSLGAQVLAPSSLGVEARALPGTTSQGNGSPAAGR